MEEIKEGTRKGNPGILENLLQKSKDMKTRTK